MKRVMFALILSVMSLTYVQTASAHVLITDETNSKGAIVHIMPDDNPIAGEPATVFFDLQKGSYIRADTKVTVTIEDKNNKQVRVPMTRDMSLATITYIFPEQGQYRLTFTVTSSSQKTTFIHTQRVSRGIVGSNIDTPMHEWAQIALIGCSVGIAMLCIFGFNRRKSIARRSTF